MRGGKATLCVGAKMCMQKMCKRCAKCRRILLFICKLKEYVICDSQKISFGSKSIDFPSWIRGKCRGKSRWRKSAERMGVVSSVSSPNQASTSEAYPVLEAIEAWRSWRFLKSTVLTPLLHDCFEELLVVLHFPHERLQIACVEVMSKVVGLEDLRFFIGICPGVERPSDGFHLIHLGVTKPIICGIRHICLWLLLKLRDWGGFLWQGQGAGARALAGWKTWRGVAWRHSCCSQGTKIFWGTNGCEVANRTRNIIFWDHQGQVSKPWCSIKIGVENHDKVRTLPQTGWSQTQCRRLEWLYAVTQLFPQSSSTCRTFST